MAKEEDRREQRIVKGPNGRMQIKRARLNGLTRERRERFLANLAATSNVTASAREIGINVTSLFALRRRDPEFAAQWDEALDCAEARLIGKLHVWAETQGTAAPAASAAAADAEANDMAGFDPILALEALRLYRGRTTGRQRRIGARPRVASAAEVEEAVMTLLAKLDARYAREKKRKAAKERAAGEGPGEARGDGADEESRA